MEAESRLAILRWASVPIKSTPSSPGRSAMRSLADSVLRFRAWENNLGRRALPSEPR